MLIRNKLAILMTLFGVALAALSSARESIALADLAAQGVPTSAASIISDRLRNELFSAGYFNVIERSQMEEILKEQGFQQTGCTSDACAVQVGQLLGVQYIAIGSVGLLGSTYTMNIRVIDVKTGEIIRSASEDFSGKIDMLLKKSVPKIAKQISLVTQQKTIETAKSPNSATGSKKSPALPEKAAPDLDPNSAKITPAASTQVPGLKDTPAKKQAKNRLIPRIVAGVVTVSGLGAGLYYNNIVQSEAQKSINYQNLANNGDAITGPLDEERSRASKELSEAAVTPRFISYLAAGLGALGFAVTFVF